MIGGAVPEGDWRRFLSGDVQVRGEGVQFGWLVAERGLECVGQEEKSKRVEGGQFNVQFEARFQAVGGVREKAGGEFVVKKVTSLVDGGRGLDGEVLAQNPQMAGRPGEKAEGVRGEADALRVAVPGFVLDCDPHGRFLSGRRFMETWTLRSCRPPPLKVPRNGAASR